MRTIIVARGDSTNGIKLGKISPLCQNFECLFSIWPYLRPTLANFNAYFYCRKTSFYGEHFFGFVFFLKQKNMLFSLIVLRNLYFLGLFIKKRLRVRVAYEQEKSEKLGNVLDRLTYTRLAGDLRQLIYSA